MSTQRVYALLAVFTLFIGLIGYRVISFQLVRSDELSRQALAVRLEEDIVPAMRGTIYDARGVPLATNIPRARVWAVLSQVEDPAGLAVQLAPLVGETPEVLLTRLTTPEVDWVLLARQVSPEASDQLTALDHPGLVVEPEPGRVYPAHELAAHVLGFTNYEHEGAYGIEGEHDDVIGGIPGRLQGERDGEGNVIGLSPSTWQAPVDGADVVLTLDSAVQRIIERVLFETIQEQGASGGTIIVQDPRTGAILGMASYPTFDPNSFSEEDDISVFTNPAVSQVYEPGSTFKAIVMAIGIDLGVVTPDTVHDDAPGYVEVPGHAPITNNEGRVWGEETMTQVLEHSTNLGAIFVAQRIGRERFYQRLADFGIGKLSGVDLQGEERGILTKPWESDWNDTLYYTNAFGQGVAVTPVQLINALSAIVNGGHLMEPYVVAEEHWPDGSVVSYEPQVVREVISEETSATLRAMLYSVVENGTGIFAQVPGYAIGAKTGTAQIPSPDGGYMPDATTASIIGFGPVEEPQFSVLVKIDAPTESEWGETVAGPALQQVFTELFALYGIAPTEEVQ
jgi:cell division protein FtsI/penicillin-binding protein 2